MKNYGGDLSKRWHIDYFENGKSKREWIPANPRNQSREDYAGKKLLAIKKRTGYIPAQLPDRLRSILHLKIAEQKDLKKRTVDTYRSDANIFVNILVELGVKSFRDVTPGIVEKYKEILVKRYAPKTVNNKLDNSGLVFNMLKYKKDPFAGITGFSKSITEDSDLNAPFTEYEQQQIEKVLKKTNYRLYLFTRFIFYAYIRPEELRHLQVKDINMMTKTIKIRAEISKNGKTQFIPIMKPLAKLIEKERLLNHPKHYYLFGADLETNDTLEYKNHATNEHRKVLLDLKIYRYRETVLYSWKHTGNIRAYLAGVDIRVIQMINRHSSLEMTERYLRKLGLFLDPKVYDFDF